MPRKDFTAMPYGKKARNGVDYPLCLLRKGWSIYEVYAGRSNL
jgi:hypothetical protein